MTTIRKQSGTLMELTSLLSDEEWIKLKEMMNEPIFKVPDFIFAKVQLDPGDAIASVRPASKKNPIKSSIPPPIVKKKVPISINF